jgi:hypothetical protein
MEEIRKLDSGWADIFGASHLKRDYDAAVQYVDNRIVRRKILKWIEEVASGNENPHSLRDALGC